MQEFFSSTPSLINVRDFPKLLRTGSKSKLNQPGMHFKAQTTLERVFDTIKGNEALIEEKDTIGTYKDLEKKYGVKPPHDNTDISKSFGKTFSSLSNSSSLKPTINMVEASRKLRSSLHNKTHFQAVLALVHKQSKSLAQPIAKRQINSAELEEAFNRMQEKLGKIIEKKKSILEIREGIYKFFKSNRKKRLKVRA
jgi:predicted transcriptional regulator